MVVNMIKNKIMGDKFPTDVFIVTKRGNGNIVSYDKAGFFNRTKNGERVYLLQKRGHTVKPMSFENMMQTANGKPFVALYEFERGEYIPIDFSQLKPDSRSKMKLADLTIDEDLRNWRVIQDRRAEALHKKESTLEKYGGVIMMLLMFIFVIIMAWLFMSQITEGATEIANALKEVKNAAPG